MHRIHMHAGKLPLVRDMGFIVDQHGTYRHPDRKFNDINVFIYVQKGCIHVIEDDIPYRLFSGSYLFLSKNIAHWGGDNYEPSTEWFYIHLYDTDEHTAALPEYRLLPQHALIPLSTYNSRIVLPKTGVLSQVLQPSVKLSQMLHHFDAPSSFSPLQLSLLVYQFFISLYAKHTDQSTHSKSDHIVNRLRELLLHAKGQRLSSTDIANHFGMNYAYLSTLFKQHTGITIKRFQNELLIEQAIDLFKSNYGNVSEVSDALGFSNPYYFSRVFKQVTGVSPINYMNEHYKQH